MDIIKQIATQNRFYQKCNQITVKGIMLHSVGCPQPSGQVFAKHMNNFDPITCSHAFIDANDGKIYQVLPWDINAYHCGGTANETYIGVELCEPPYITYTDGANFTCRDKEKAIEQVKLALASAVELFAFLCNEYSLDPLANGVIISHKEGADRGIASAHADPEHLFKQLEMNYSMDDFRNEVALKMSDMGYYNKALDVKPVEEIDTIKDNDIKAGDVVAIKKGAMNYDGKKLPDWITDDKWIVKNVAGNRVLIDKNISGTRSNLTAINAMFLEKLNS